MKKNYLTKVLTMLILAISLIVLPCIGVYAQVREYAYKNPNNYVTNLSNSICTTEYFNSATVRSCSPYLKIKEVIRAGDYYAGNYINGVVSVMTKYSAAIRTEGQVIRAILGSQDNQIFARGIVDGGVRMLLDYARVDC